MTEPQADCVQRLCITMSNPKYSKMEKRTITK